MNNTFFRVKLNSQKIQENPWFLKKQMFLFDNKVTRIFSQIVNGRIILLYNLPPDSVACRVYLCTQHACTSPSCCLLGTWFNWSCRRRAFECYLIFGILFNWSCSAFECYLILDILFNWSCSAFECYLIFGILFNWSCSAFECYFGCCSTCSLFTSAWKIG